MEFTALPPEINSARMYAGAGAAPMLAAATAWDELATELSSIAGSFRSAIARLTGDWLGPAATAMATAAATITAWVQAGAA